MASPTALLHAPDVWGTHPWVPGFELLIWRHSWLPTDTGRHVSHRSRSPGAWTKARQVSRAGLLTHARLVAKPRQHQVCRHPGLDGASW